VKIADLARDMIKLSGLEPDVDIEIKYVGLRDTVVLKVITTPAMEEFDALRAKARAQARHLGMWPSVIGAATVGVRKASEGGKL
jgi:hypothetical protein